MSLIMPSAQELTLFRLACGVAAIPPGKVTSDILYYITPFSREGSHAQRSLTCSTKPLKHASSPRLNNGLSAFFQVLLPIILSKTTEHLIHLRDRNRS